MQPHVAEFTRRALTADDEQDRMSMLLLSYETSALRRAATVDLTAPMDDDQQS